MERQTTTNKIHLSLETLWFREEFNKRVSKNSNYSIRAFARYLAMDSSCVSQMLSGQRKITKKTLDRLKQRLGSSPQPKTKETAKPFLMLDTSSTMVVKDWQAYAILELTNTIDFDPEPKWIAKRLGLPVPQVRETIEKLLDVGLLRITDKKLYKTNSHITNLDPGVTSNVRKELQRQLVKRAVTAIDEIPQEVKDITSITFPADMSRFSEARQLIAEFRRSLAKFMSSGDSKEVYNLTIQLTPATEIKKVKDGVQ